MKEDYYHVLLSASIEKYLLHCEYERRLDEKTIGAYRLDLNKFAEGMEPTTLLCSINRDDVRKWVHSLSSYRHKTIKRKIASLQGFMKYMEAEYDEFENPMRRLQIRIKNPIRLPEVMTAEEVKCLLDRLEKEANSSLCKSRSHVLKVRNRAVIELLFGSGMRIGELCCLRNKDVDLHNGQVHIIGKGNKERVVDVCLPVILDAMYQWLAVRTTSPLPDEFFFTNLRGQRLDPQTVRALVGQLRNVCHINKHITPHTFRHTFATLLLEENVDITYIQQLLGHSSISTTQIYLHVSPPRQRDIMLTRHPRRMM